MTITRQEFKLPVSFQNVFRRVAIAEDEIKSALDRKDLKEEARKRVDGVFLALRPGGPLTSGGCTEEVYRHHVRELLDRVIVGDDLDPGTDAEVLMMLSNTSLRAPLNAVGQGLYERLFVRVFRKLPFKGGVREEPWPGACEDFLRACRAKLARDRRSL
jgi:hypothetical protein